MARRIGQRDVLWLSLLSGAFVVLAIQIFLGATSGFDRPHGNLFVRLLESPGIVLGWGGAALCVVAIPYALVSWTRGQSPGKVLAVLGTVVCAIGVAGLAGVVAGANHVRGGGAVGGALAHLLVEAMGSVLAFIVLLAIAIPGLLLALGPLMLDTSPVGPARPKRPEAKPWYPKPQVGEDGLEVPMKLPGTDVGPIRYREPEPEPAPSAAVPTSTPEPPAAAAAPTTAEDAEPAARPPTRPKARPIAGVRYADGGDDDGTAIAEVADAPARAAAPPVDASLPFGVRYAAPLEEAAPPPASPPVPPAPPAPPAPPEGATEAPLVSEAAVAATSASELAGDVGAAEAETPTPRRAPKPPKASKSPKGSSAPAAAAAPPAPAAPKSPPERPARAKAAEPAEPVDLVDPAVAESAPAIPASAQPPQPSVASHREKLATSGVFERSRPGGAHGGRAPMPKPKPAKPQSLKEALRGLFTNLPVDELPPARTPLADDDEPPKAPAPQPDAPGQLTLFGAPAPGAAAKSAVAHPAAADDLFPAAVDAALERGTASLVLLKRKLNIGYARAASLMEALVSEGILGEMTASGSRPTLVTAAEWAKRKKA